MGSLTIPSSGRVYFDTNAFIYSVERIQPYSDVLQSVWAAAESGQIEIQSSEIALLEVLVKPLREADSHLESVYRDLLLGSDEVSLIPLSLTIVEQAAGIRASTGLKAPDAIHAATALSASAQLFVTNDPGFRRVEGLPVTVLSEFLPAPVARVPRDTVEAGVGRTPSPFPVREAHGQGWQVLIVPGDDWLTCESREDAQAVAAAPVLEYQSLERVRSGPEFATELETTAAALVKYRINFGARFFRRRAEEARTGD